MTVSPEHPQPSSPEDLNRQTVAQRAVDAAIWGMPIVSVNAMRRAFFRDARANYDDVVFWSKPSDWKNQTTTPNASARYIYFNFNTKERASRGGNTARGRSRIVRDAARCMAGAAGRRWP
jgi:hypothetical protein